MSNEGDIVDRIASALSPEKIRNIFVGFKTYRDGDDWEEDNVYLYDLLEDDEIARLSKGLVDILKGRIR